MVEFKVQRERKLDDGVHNGTIIEVEYREKPYEYTDLVIELADKMQVRVGFPSFVTDTSKLGRAMAKFGAILTIDSMINPEVVFVGKKCQFQTITKPGKDGKNYYSVIPESVKPIP